MNLDDIRKCLIKNKIECVKDEIARAEEYFNRQNASEFERHVIFAKNHIRSLVAWAGEWVEGK